MMSGVRLSPSRTGTATVGNVNRGELHLRNVYLNLNTCFCIAYTHTMFALSTNKKGFDYVFLDSRCASERKGSFVGGPHPERVFPSDRRDVSWGVWRDIAKAKQLELNVS